MSQPIPIDQQLERIAEAADEVVSRVAEARRVRREPSTQVEALQQTYMAAMSAVADLCALGPRSVG